MTHSGKRALSNTGVYFLGIVLERGIALAMLPVLTLLLSPGQLGIYALLFLSATIINYLASSPLTVALQRFYYAPQYARQQNDLLGSLLLILIAKTLLLAGLYWLSAELICRWLTGGGEYLGLVRLYTLVVALTPLPMLTMLRLQMQHRARTSAAISAGAAVVGAIVTLYFLVGQRAGVISLAYGHIAQLSVLVAASWPSYLAAARWNFSWNTLRQPLYWGYSLLPASYSDLAIQSADRYMLAGLVGVGATGIYDVGYRLASLVSVSLIQPAKRSLHPWILQLENDPPAQKQMLRVTANYFYLIGMFIALGVSLFAREAVAIICRTDAFRAAWIVVPVVALAYLQLGMGHFFNFGIVMAKRGWTDSAIVVISAAVNVGLNLLLIPPLGIIGAAVATLASYLVWNALKLYYSWKYYALSFDLGRLLHVTVIGSGIMTAAYWLPSWETIGVAGTLASKAAALAAYPLLLWASGYFTTAEKETAGRFVRRLLCVDRAKQNEPINDEQTTPSEHRDAA